MTKTLIFKALLLTLSAAASFGFATTAAAQTTAQAPAAPEVATKPAGKVQVQWLDQAAFKN